MSLERILSKVRTGVRNTLLGLALAVLPAYSGCGTEPDEVVYKETRGGLYTGTFVVTEDPQHMILPVDLTGDIEVPVIPLDDQEKNYLIGVFDWQEYELNEQGQTDTLWFNAYDNATYHVWGTISQGKLNLDASMDGVAPWNNGEFYVEWHLDGEKQNEYPEGGQ